MMKLTVQILLVSLVSARIFDVNINNIKTKMSRMKQPDPEELTKHAVYSAAALCSDDKLKAWSCKSCDKVEERPEIVKTFEDNVLGVRGYVGVTNSSIILAFRDTVNIMNVVSDLAMTPIISTMPGGKNVLLHGGFKASSKALARKFLPVIKAQLKSYQDPSRNVVVVGHSLGGAMAALSAIKIYENLHVPWRKISLYTYGQPRTGDLAFARWFNRKPLSVARVVNYNDPIPHATPAYLYAHHHHEYFISANGIKSRYCSVKKIEDPTCSNSVSPLKYNILNHFNYFEVDFSPNSC